jgi:AcrR family transcriptional regulator
MPRVAKKERWAAAVPPREEQFEAKRIALIREAAKAFGQKGFHNTSLDDVAEALHVTKPALYYYIKTKHEILFECHNMALDFGIRAREIAAAASSDPAERLRIYLLTYIEMMTENIHAYGVLREPLSSLPLEYRKKIVMRLREADRQLRELIQANIDAGKLPASDPSMAVAFFMGAINHISRWYSHNGRYSGKQVAEMFTDFILHGLKGATPLTARAGRRQK